MVTVTDTNQRYGATYTPPDSQVPTQIQPVIEKYGATYTPPLSGGETFAKDWLGIQNPGTYFKDALNQASDFILHPIKAVEDAAIAGGQAIGGAFKGAYDANKTVLGDITGPSTWAKKTADVLHSIGTDAAVLFSPISAAFAAASKLPVLKEAGDVLTAPFAITGKIGDFAAEKFIDVLPLDQASKDVLKPAFGEIGALAGQILLGGKIMDLVSKGGVPDKVAIDKLVTDTKNETEIAAQHAQSPEITAQKYGADYTPSPQERLANYSRAQGYEPYTPPDQLPTIDVGRASNDLPTIQTEPKPSTRMGSLTIEPIKDTPVEPAKATVLPPATPDIAKTATAPEIAPVTIDRPVLDNGMRVTKAANDINQKLVEKGIEQLPPEEQSQYKTGSYTQDKASVVKLMDTNLQAAKDMAIGKIPVSTEIRYPQILYEAVKQLAIKEGDVRLQKDLAKASFGTYRSEAAGTLGSAGFLRPDGSVDPVQALRDLGKTSEGKVKAKSEVRTKDLQTLKNEVKSVKPKKQDWASFVKSIQC